MWMQRRTPFSCCHDLNANARHLISIEEVERARARSLKEVIIRRRLGLRDGQAP